MEIFTWLWVAELRLNPEKTLELGSNHCSFAGGQDCDPFLPTPSYFWAMSPRRRQNQRGFIGQRANVPFPELPFSSLFSEGPLRDLYQVSIMFLLFIQGAVFCPVASTFLFKANASHHKLPLAKPFLQSLPLPDCLPSSVPPTSNHREGKRWL